MGSTGTPAIPAEAVNGKALVQGGINPLLVPFTFTLSASYATGGDTVTLPDSQGRQFISLVLLTTCDGTRRYSWNGNTATPKVQSFTAFATESSATTDLSSVSLKAIALFV